MKLPKHIRLIIAAALQIFIILTIVVFKLLIIGNGTEVLLRIQPVDPRDPFRGDYLTFSYEISNPQQYVYWDIYSEFAKSTIRNGDTVFVQLYKNGDYWSVYSVSKEKPIQESERDHDYWTAYGVSQVPIDQRNVFIKGTVISGGITNPSGSDYKGGFYQTLQIRYGIEEFFIPEGTGLDIGSEIRDGNASAVVRIGENGDAVLKQIYINGKAWPK